MDDMGYNIDNKYEQSPIVIKSVLIPKKKAMMISMNKAHSDISIMIHLLTYNYKDAGMKVKGQLFKVVVSELGFIVG